MVMNQSPNFNLGGPICPCISGCKKAPEDRKMPARPPVRWHFFEGIPARENLEKRQNFDQQVGTLEACKYSNNWFSHRHPLSQFQV